MLVCRAFHRDRPFEQIDSRPLAEGEMSVGRDADWSLPDPSGVLSRIHLILSARAGKVVVHDRSTNGAYLADGRRLPRGEPHELAVRDRLSVGELILVIDEISTKAADPPVMTARSAPPASASRHDASLLEAFCDGAKLDASALSAEDPHEVMRRAGEIYRQTVAHLAALMAERASARQDRSADRTTIGPAANNPFKWTASRRLAQDLLLNSAAGFLPGGEAVRESFEDLASFLRSETRRAEEAVGEALQRLSPDSIETEAKAQHNVLRSKHAVCWDILVRRHAAAVAAEQTHTTPHSAPDRTLNSGSR